MDGLGLCARLRKRHGGENVRVCSEGAGLDWLEGLSDRLCLFEGRSLGGGGDGGSEDLGGIPDPKTNDSRRWLTTAQVVGISKKSKSLKTLPSLPSGAFGTVPATYRV